MRNVFGSELIYAGEFAAFEMEINRFNLKGTLVTMRVLSHAKPHMTNRRGIALLK